ncbi:MAG: cyclase family protein [Planctomycetes bacterium]|nr:cyclase family protein [Planctomycetota bacterium]
MKIIDISPLIDEHLAVWPGDVSFTREISCALSQGDNFGLSSFNTTTHLGAHTDAPNHYSAGGSGIDQVDLNKYYGECQVISVNVARSKRIQCADIKVKITARRVLLRTNSAPDRTVFNTDFNSLSVELLSFLQQQHVELIGIDTPSVDAFECKQLLAHNQIARTDMAILEGIDLSQVEDGKYILCALPLKIAHSDSSPVRAVLLDPNS